LASDVTYQQRRQLYQSADRFSRRHHVATLQPTAAPKSATASHTPVMVIKFFTKQLTSNNTGTLVMLTCKLVTLRVSNCHTIKGKGSSYSITECRVPELIPVLGSQHAGFMGHEPGRLTMSHMSHKPGSRLPLLSARPTVTLTTLKRAATNFAAW